MNTDNNSSELINDDAHDNNNELQYSIRSVIKYAPWINKIYILMNPPKKNHHGLMIHFQI